MLPIAAQALFLPVILNGVECLLFLGLVDDDAVVV